MANRRTSPLKEWMCDLGWDYGPEPFSKPENRICQYCEKQVGACVFSRIREGDDTWVYCCMECAVDKYEGNDNEGILPCPSDCGGPGPSTAAPTCADCGGSLAYADELDVEDVDDEDEELPCIEALDEDETLCPTCRLKRRQTKQAHQQGAESDLNS